MNEIKKTRTPSIYNLFLSYFIYLYLNHLYLYNDLTYLKSLLPLTLVYSFSATGITRHLWPSTS